jgi:hypothetical protein
MPADPTLLLEAGTYMEMVRAIGFPALIFLIWVIYHRSENEKWEKNFNAQREMQRDTIQGMMLQNREEREKQFLLWKELSEILHLQTSQLSRLDSKISANEFCPIVRRNKQE